ncbi:MAG: type I restriction enzyme HsdR N-terminal domain-containing protein [Plectolyngbya sp. WJT66-NPBG17]|jgi:predicted type IV restriction endonuclease|nr:type I restriction enzyme HsdR N-terminal domain-containing protein [Plectolyngbya sp. WJT66-NPBG17]MBW4525305.1 type I restriction enzyme HsdR N-terminal domain-containing protein [Phormidium tanganyikae FI6-MK23]
MIQAISKQITSLNQVHEKFGSWRTDSDHFFTEPWENLPQLSNAEKERLDQIKRRYEYQRADLPLLEETVKMLVVSPLLDLAGFYEPPFRFQTETPVSFELDDEEEKLQGRIDALVLQQRFWILVVEAKHTKVEIEVGIPQLLAYMMGNPFPSQAAFGMVTNGVSFAFAKAFQQEYDVSRVYSLLPRQNELYEVLQILRSLGSAITQN